MREILKTGTLQEVIDTLESGIEEYDMNSIKADSASNDTFLLCDPVVFIPDVNLFAVCMEYCLGDADGMLTGVEPLYSASKTYPETLLLQIMVTNPTIS